MISSRNTAGSRRCVYVCFIPGLGESFDCQTRPVYQDFKEMNFRFVSSWDLRQIYTPYPELKPHYSNLKLNLSILERLAVQIKLFERFEILLQFFRREFLYVNSIHTRTMVGKV